MLENVEKNTIKYSFIFLTLLLLMLKSFITIIIIKNRRLILVQCQLLNYRLHQKFTKFPTNIIFQFQDHIQNLTLHFDSNLSQFLSLSLSLMTDSFRRLVINNFVKYSLTQLCLMFSHDWGKIMQVLQKYHRNDIVSVFSISYHMI